MPAITASAPGKTILVGEHAVVHHQPAIAVPVPCLKAKVNLRANPLGEPGAVHILAPGVNLDAGLDELDQRHPIRFAIQTVLDYFEIPALPAVEIHISSSLPVGGGMGSSAAVSVALIRGVSAFIGHPLDNSLVNLLAFEVEKLQHGNPSGIDNTVITYARPIFYSRGQPFEILQVREPVHLVIAGSGIQGSTGAMVAGVQQRFQQHLQQYQEYFDRIGTITMKVRHILEGGPVAELGALLNENQTLLEKIGVSTPELNHLVNTALAAGALGAKLTGGGGGGNIIAQAGSDQVDEIAGALQSAGAVNTTVWTIPANYTGVQSADILETRRITDHR